MKPIIGEVVSSKPLSLDEAASILANFISKGTGATQEMTAYLARTRAAFDELVEYHRHVKLRVGASEREDSIKEREKSRKKHSSKRLKEEFDGQCMVPVIETALLETHLESNGHVEAKQDCEVVADEKGHKKKMKKYREYEFEPATLEGPVRSKLSVLQSDDGAENNGKAEVSKEVDRRKKKEKKRSRNEEGGAGNKGISDSELEPPSKKKKKQKVIEYEVETERNVQCY